MERFIQADGGGVFELFGLTHLMTLAVFFLLGAIIYFFRAILKRPSINEAARLFLSAVLLLSEISLHGWLVWADNWAIAYSLPLHLSSLSLFTSIIMLFTRNVLLFEFSYFAGLGSAVQAMLTPDLYSYTFPHFRYVHFFISHGFVVLACIFMVAVEGYKPTVKSILRALLLLNGYAFIIFGVNLIIGGNFMYLMRKPTNPSLLDYLGPWPYYLISLEGIVLLSFFILYLPFYIRDLNLNRKVIK